MISFSSLTGHFTIRAKVTELSDSDAHYLLYELLRRLDPFMMKEPGYGEYNLACDVVMKASARKGEV